MNLLEDHLVDLLIDVAASGENVVEREGLSVRHPARFVLVGSGNPEEGELRPQLLDRFGLSVEVRTPQDIATRIAIVRRRDAFDRDRAAFARSGRGGGSAARARIEAGAGAVAGVAVPDARAGSGDHALPAARHGRPAGRADAAARRPRPGGAGGRGTVTQAHLLQDAPLALRHRLRRDPLDEAGSTARVARAVQEQFGA